ncbi:MAG: cytochrome c peroxidase [Myxococcales bacterium]|nr:cytochrome c peroxidase [Myxococcales bacterium]
MARASGVFIVAVAALAGCTEWVAPRPGLTEQDQALLSSMVLRGMPVDPRNEYLDDAAVAEFGQQLFFDRGLSRVVLPDAGPMDGGLTDGGIDPLDAGYVLTDTGYPLATQGVACVHCHVPAAGFSDDRTARNVSLGLRWTARNSPTVLNVAFYEWWGWDGRADTLWGQSVHAYDSPATMGGDPLRLARALAARYSDRYRALFGELLPDLDDARFEPPRAPDAEAELRRIYDRSMKAWAAYMSRLNSFDSPFDRFAQGDDHALGEGARRGLTLFFGKAGCVQCHRGPMFTDNQFHSVGLGQTGLNVPSVDKGRSSGLDLLKKLPTAFRRVADVPAPTESDVGRFRTKSLRNVSLTGPYMHAGQLETLKDVVWFYNRGGDRDGLGTPSVFMEPLGLTESEQSDLVLFLESLTGQPPDARWSCDNSRETVEGMERRFGAPCAVIP